MIQSYSPFLSTQSRRLIPKHNPNRQQHEQDKLSISSKMSIQDGSGLKAKNKKIIRNLEKQYEGVYENREYLLSSIHQSQSKMNNFFISKVPRFRQQSNQTGENQSSSHFDDRKNFYEHPIQFVNSSSKVQSQPKFFRISTQKNVCYGRSETNKQVPSKRKIPFSVLNDQNQGQPIPIKDTESHRIYELTDKKISRLNTDFFKNFRYRANIDRYKVSKECKLVQNVVDPNQNLSTESNRFKAKESIIKSKHKSSKVNKTEATKDKGKLSLILGSRETKKLSFIDCSPSRKKITRNGGYWTSQKQRYFDILTKKANQKERIKTGENLHVKKLQEKCGKYLGEQKKNLGVVEKKTKVNSLMKNHTLLKNRQKYLKFTREQNRQKEENIKAILQKKKEYKSIGPGYYKNTHKSIQDINQRNGRNPAPQYQFFGSTKIRFQNPNNQVPRHQLSTTDSKSYAKEKKVKPQNGKLKAFGCTAENLKRTDKIKETILTNRYRNEQNPLKKFKPYDQ